MKKFLSILLSAVMVLSLAACGAKEATPNGDQSNTVNEDGTRDTYVTIKVGTGHNKNSFFYTGLAEFERLVEENTKGAVQIDIFTDGALGSEGEMAEGLTMGTVDSGLLGSSSVAKLNPPSMCSPCPISLRTMTTSTQYSAASLASSSVTKSGTASTL